MKPRRDITLGEMQDECKFRGCDCSTLGGGMCDYFDVCESMHNKKDNFQSPCDWGLTDPPRFTEQQMALLRGLHQNGASKIIATMANTDVYGRNGNKMAEIDNSVFCIAWGETLDLAELLGKDAT